MKRIRVSLLVLVLSVSAYAGDMPNMPPSLPPPPSSSTTVEPADPVTVIALDLLQAVLALF